MSLNPKKTKDVSICFKESFPEPPQLSIDGTFIERVNAFKLLGVLHQDNLNYEWNSHVEYITKRANKRLFFLRESCRANLPTEVVITCHVTKIRPLLEYRTPIWVGLPRYFKNKLKLQRRSFKMLGLPHAFLP